MSDATTDSNRVNNVGGFLVAWGLLLCFMYVTYVVMHNDIPDKNQNTVVFILGFLTAQIGTVINWYYGNSASSKKQTETIATAVDTAAKAQNVIVANSVVPSTEKNVELKAGEAATVHAEPNQP